MTRKKEGEDVLKQELRKEKVPEKKRRQILKQVKEKREKKKTMNLAVKEGSFSSIMNSLGNSYIIPYALALNATNFQIGLLKSFHGLLPPVTQLFSSKLMKKFSRKKIILINISLQALMFLPIILLSLLFFNNLFTTHLPYILIVFYTLFAIFGAIALPAWFSLMGDVVPDNRRGYYFGKREKIAGTIGLIATLASAFLLDYFKTKGMALMGFSMLFLTASIARFVCVFYTKKYYEPKFKYKKDKSSFFKFILNKSNFTKFSLFSSIMYLSVMIASPFFSVYMLKELDFSYTVFMIINMSSVFSAIFTAPLWGKFSDKYGRKESLILSSIFISIMPILWFFSSSPPYLILPMLIVGVGWSGFNLASFSFMYDNLTPEKRSKGIAHYNILIGIGVFIGSALGGLILNEIPSFLPSINSFLTIFFISSLLRALTSMIFLPQIKEVRKVRKFKPLATLKRFGPTHNLQQHLIHNFLNIEKEAGKSGKDD